MSAKPVEVRKHLNGLFAFHTFISASLAQSYLQAIQPSFNAGAQMVNAIYARQEQAKADAERLAFQEEQQNRRYEMQQKNALAMLAAEKEAKAKEIAAQRFPDWNKKHWNDTFANYQKQLDQDEVEIINYLNPEKIYQKSPESVKQAQTLRKWIPEQRQKLASAVPADWSEFQDPTPYIVPRPEFTPGESEEFRKERLKKNEYMDARIDSTQASTANANARTANVGKTASGATAGKKTRNSFLTKRGKFIAATENFYGTQPSVDEATGSMDPAKHFGDKQVAAAKSWTGQAAPFIQDLANPAIVGKRVSTVVKAFAPRYNNLASPADFHNMLNDLSKEKFSNDKEGVAAHDAVTTLRSLMIDPVYDPFGDDDE